MDKDNLRDATEIKKQLALCEKKVGRVSNFFADALFPVVDVYQPGTIAGERIRINNYRLMIDCETALLNFIDRQKAELEKELEAL